MADRRDEVVRVAAEEIAERGYYQASFGTIAKKLGMTKGNLQYYFPSKAAMAQEIANRASPGDHHPLTADALPPGTRGLVEMVTAMANEYVNSPFSRASIRLSEEGNFRADPRRSLHDEWIAVIKQLAEQAANSGELDSNLDVSDFSIRFLGAFIGTRVISLLRGEIEQFPERARASAIDLINSHRLGDSGTST